MPSEPMSEERLARIAEMESVALDGCLYKEHVGELLAEVRRLQQCNAEAQAALQRMTDMWDVEYRRAQELERDKERCDWMIKYSHSALVESKGKWAVYFGAVPFTGWCETPRGAVDAAKEAKP